MTRPPPASGDQVPARPSPSPHNPTAAHTQDNRAERAALLRDFIGEALEPVERDALDHVHLEEIARLSDLASSYCKSLPLAASRGDKLTLAVHCREAAPVIREALTLVQELAREGSWL